LSLNRFYAYGRFKTKVRESTRSDIQLAGFVDSFNKDPRCDQLPEDILTAIPELNQYKMPDRGKTALLKSLFDNVGKGIELNDLNKECLSQATDILIGAALKVTPNLDSFSYHDFIETIYRLDPSKSSGFPSTLFAPLKGQIFDSPELMDDLLQAVIFRVGLLNILGSYCSTPDDFHNCFLADILNISIKEEPIKATKDYGRIVTAPGIVTIFIESMLYNRISTDMKNQLYEGYSGIGIGFDNYHSYILNVKHEGAKFSSDVPTFDWTVTLFEALNWQKYVSAVACFGPFKSNLSRQLERSYFHKFYNIFGDVFRHNNLEGQPSGRWGTADVNTFIRSCRAIAAALVSITIIPQEVPLLAITSVGDDCEETPLSNLSDCYSILSFPLRDAEINNTLQLCSHEWPLNSVPYGKRILKSLYHMLMDINQETVLGFMMKYGYHPLYEQLMYSASVVRPEVNMFILVNNAIPAFTSLRRIDLPIDDLDNYHLLYSACKPKKSKVLKKVAKAGVKIVKKVVKKEVSNLTGINTDNLERVLSSLTDPFCGEAARARYPDQGAGRSLTSQFKYTVNVTTSTTGNFAYAFNPKPNFSGVSWNGAAIVGAAVTWATTYALGDASTDLINTYGLTYRPTSMGISVSNLLSATNSQGYIIAAKGGAPPLNSSTTFNPVNFTAWKVHPVTHGETFHIVAKPLSPESYAYGTVAAGAANNYNDDSWETIFIAGFGLPNSTSSLLIEVIVNCEYTPKEDSPIATLAVDQPLMDVAMQTAVNHVQMQHPPTHKGTNAVANFIKREGKKALSKHVIPYAKHKFGL